MAAGGNYHVGDVQISFRHRDLVHRSDVGEYQSFLLIFGVCSCVHIAFLATTRSCFAMK